MSLAIAEQPAKAAHTPLMGALPVYTKPSELDAIFGVRVDRMTLRRWEKAGKWPKRVALSYKVFAWHTSDLIAHMNLDPATVIAAWNATRAIQKASGA